MTQDIDFSARDPQAGVDKLFSERWSPRAFKNEPVSAQDLEKIFEAARWAPSAYNEQPWRFVTCNESSHEKFVSLLVEANQAWAKNAPVIGFILAEKKYTGIGAQIHGEGTPNNHNKFDTGAAWMSMTMQAAMLGLYTHAMAGINYQAVYEAFDIDPESTDVICGFVLGPMGDPQTLPEQQRNREKPTPRKPLSEIWKEI